MTNSQKIWELLQKAEEVTINEISKTLDIRAVSVALYIRALFNAGYMVVDTPHTKIKRDHKISLVKNTGAMAPVLNKNSNLLTDNNILAEIIVSPSGSTDKHSKAHKLLAPILQAIVKIGKNELYRKEINEKMNRDPYVLQRWIPRLEEYKVLIKTEETYRNSTLYKVDLEKTKTLLNLVNSFKSSALAFKKLSAQ